MVNVLSFIKKKKDAFQTKRLQVMNKRAEALEESAEKHAKRLEELSKHKKAYMSAMERQSEAKAVIRESRRMEHPLLYKIGDSVKNKFAEAQKNKTNSKIMGKSNNVFSNTSNQEPYWLKETKNSKNDMFGNKSKTTNVFTQQGNTPYWLKQNKRKR